MTGDTKKLPRTSHGCRQYATGDVSVLESSLAFEGPHVRICGGRRLDDRVHLSLAHARIVVEGLQVWIAEAEAGSLTEQPDEAP